MRSFFVWVETAGNTNITIGYSTIEKALKQVAEKTIDRINEKKHQVSLFNVDDFFKEISTQFADYPYIKNLLNALKSKNKNYIFDQYRKLSDWASQKSQDHRGIVRKIFIYWDWMDNQEGLLLAEKDIENAYQKAMQDTEIEMNKIQNIIQSAISRIPHWNNSPIHIEAYYAENEQGIMLEGGNGAEISLGTGEWNPSFSLFQIDEKIVIDDVLEGGDTDFFENSEIQADYFNLINEIRKPGSTNKGKTLTLYTARPKKDREQLINSPVLPKNIFLTNDFAHAEGLGIDLGGNRDIWKIRIDSRYLTQTLDGPIKYYQITANNAPAQMFLLQVAD